MSRGRGGSRFGATLLSIACGWTLLAGTEHAAAQAGPSAQDGARAGEAPVEPGNPPPQPQPTIHPDAVSSFLTRLYTMKPKKLWKGLLETLQASGYPPEEVDETHRTVKTSFVDFQQKDYPEDVGEEAPEFGPSYRILQLRHVVEGKVSLEVIVAPGERGSALSIRARVLVHGLDRARRIPVLTDRRSSGVIEKEFLKKLESRLGLEAK